MNQENINDACMRSRVGFLPRYNSSLGQIGVKKVFYDKYRKETA